MWIAKKMMHKLPRIQDESLCTTELKKGITSCQEKGKSNRFLVLWDLFYPCPNHHLRLKKKKEKKYEMLRNYITNRQRFTNLQIHHLHLLVL